MKLLPIKKAAKEMNISRVSLWRRIKRGTVPTVPIAKPVMHVLWDEDTKTLITDQSAIDRFVKVT